MGTGLIFAAVVALWAAYFVPLALRRYDEASRSGSIDTFSTAMRVITHREHDAAPTAPVESEVPVARPVPMAAAAAAVSDASEQRRQTRESARIAARRRRRTLLTLLGATVAVAALATFAVVPWWALLVPVALDLAWLIACRVQVRGERGLGRSAKRESAEIVNTDDEATVVLSGQIEDYDPHRKHVMEAVELEPEGLIEPVVEAVPVLSTSGTTLWDPLPVTLPTYVTKPRAARTIRTIDFGEPGAWTSGHVEGEDLDLPAPAERPAERRRAVGD